MEEGEKVCSQLKLVPAFEGCIPLKAAGMDNDDIRSSLECRTVDHFGQRKHHFASVYRVERDTCLVSELAHERDEFGGIFRIATKMVIVANLPVCASCGK